MERFLNRIICGDCLDVMRGIADNSFDALITDPPFAFTGGNSNGTSSQISGQFFTHWWRSVCDELSRIMKPTGSGFIWCDWRTAPIIADGFKPKQQTYDIWRVAQMLYHYREMPGQGQPFRSSVDMVAYVRGPKHKDPDIPKTQHNFISSYWYYGKHQYHPAEKSPKMVEMMVEWCSKKGDIVFDPFAGSCVVPVTASKLGRKFVAIEKEEDYCRIAEERLRIETQQKSLFMEAKQQNANASKVYSQQNMS